MQNFWHLGIFAPPARHIQTLWLAVQARKYAQKRLCHARQMFTGRMPWMHLYLPRLYNLISFEHPASFQSLNFFLLLTNKLIKIILLQMEGQENVTHFACARLDLLYVTMCLRVYLEHISGDTVP
jgi:hypothetical protein